MSEKYITLACEITRMHNSADMREGVYRALHWLDEHPEQVPGRTITTREAAALYNHTPFSAFVEGLRSQGITVLDPELTNADRWDELLHKAATGAMSSSTLRSLAENLADQGIKAPEAGGDDE